MLQIRKAKVLHRATAMYSRLKAAVELCPCWFLMNNQYVYDLFPRKKSEQFEDVLCGCNPREAYYPRRGKILKEWNDKT